MSAQPTEPLISPQVKAQASDSGQGKSGNARVRALRLFAGHLASYLTVGFALFRYDIGDNNRIDYVWMTLAGWGVGLVGHGIGAVFSRPEAGEPAGSLREDFSGVVGEIMASAPTDRVEAIKAISERLGVDKDLAKDLLTKYLESHPELI